MSPANPKQAGKSAGQNFLAAIFVFCASVYLALFMASPAMAQHGSHGGGSHGGGHASGSHGGGGHSGGSHGASGHGDGSAHASATPAPAHISVSMGAEGNSVAAASATASVAQAEPSNEAIASSPGLARGGFASPSATENPAANRETPIVFVSGAGRMPNAPLENVTGPAEPLAADNHLWMSPEAFAGTPQQQQQRTAPPPPPARPVPMPVAPPIMARPMPSPGVVMTPPVVMPPVMTRPMVRIPPVAGVPLPVTPVRPAMEKNFVRPGPAIRMVPPGAPRVRTRTPAPPSMLMSAPLPVPPNFGRVVLEPGIGGTTGKTFGFATTPVPPLLCSPGFPNCGLGFDGDFDDFGFGGPFFIFAFGGPFGFGGPCLFDNAFLNCFGFASEWNGPFGWGWGTPWGYNPALTGSLYPIGGYTSPTPAEQNDASVNSIGPTTFAPSQPEQLMLAPSEEQAQAVAYLVTKDGIEFGVTKYWVEDGRINYITTYNVQSSISLDQLDLQATVDFNYKLGITFTLTPKPDDQKQPEPQPQLQ